MGRLTSFFAACTVAGVGYSAGYLKGQDTAALKTGICSASATVNLVRAHENAQSRLAENVLNASHQSLLQLVSAFNNKDHVYDIGLSFMEAYHADKQAYDQWSAAQMKCELDNSMLNKGMEALGLR